MHSPKFERPRTIVITGASAGIGRAIAREFAREHARIGLIARNEEGLEAARKEVEALGGEALVLALDIADFQALDQAASKIEETFGPIDVWVNNAMNSVLGLFKDIEMEEFKRVTEVTYLGTVYGAKCALKRMQPRNRGSIVFVGSALAYRGIPLQTAYCGAKHAIEGFYDSLRTELKYENSNVMTTMVQLPGVNTTQFNLVRNKVEKAPRPMGTIYQPEVAARAIVAAADTNDREYYVGLPAVQTILGNKFFPGLMDIFLSKTGVSGQQTDQPATHGKDYLFEPVPGDHGSHGNFDDVAKESGIVVKGSTVRALASLVVFGSVIAATSLITSSLVRR
ncbi:short-subunit dehydrogenase [Lewinella marina]|uniref:Short-chain dehydrogenase n=1 Tax=Neolewinella marina TaxID=438751 RepID=A0A2G0CD25_9BACT|nr:SDR family oxidoreductase [Neolewinella marina]NJB86942.1 short-subunit dehydrogenase [Neolewinella marina]PHK97862.1 short-chain dehydrogenase [Neolewinella marina]